MGKFSRTWHIMGQSWQVLKADKEILIFPLISGICCILIFASFAYPIFSQIDFSAVEENDQVLIQQNWTYYVFLFLFYLCTYFVIIFFNSAMVACAYKRMSGGDPTVGYGFQVAMSRIGAIFGWALVSATVGIILRMIEDRSRWLGKIVVALLGMAWTLTSFLAVPILVIDKQSPISALKQSAVLLKKTWGEQIIGGFSFSLVFFVLMLPAFLLILLGVLTGSIVITVTLIAAAVIYIITLSLIQSALTVIFKTAVYLYARDGQGPAAFDQDLLSSAMVPKK